MLRRSRRGRLPVALCIDAEQDDREVDRADPAWRGLESLFERLPATRRRLEHLTRAPASLSWFVRADPQVELGNGSAGWALTNYAPAWESLLADGDDVGIHCHAWRWDEPGGEWIADHGDPGWVEHCVDLGLTAYGERFGTPPPCYRGGDRFLSDAIVARLEAEGVGVDATLEPGMPATDGLVDSERGTGSIPDYTTVPRTVYRPSATDFRRPDPDREPGLRMLPLTPGGGETLYPWTDPEAFRDRLRDRLADRDLTHLAFAIRTDLALYDNAWEVLLENMEAVARLAGRRRIEFVTATEAAARAPASEPASA